MFSIFSKKMLKIDEIMVFDPAKNMQRLSKKTIQVLASAITGQHESKVAYGRNSDERYSMKNAI